MTLKFLKKTLYLLALALLVLPFTGSVLAQTPPTPVVPDYAVLVPLPGTTYNCNVVNSQGATVQTECSDLSRYLPNAFNLTIGLSVALAFIVITVGGVTYATSDALSGKSKGRELIENALWGLLLVIGAFIILQTINPQILTFDLRIDRFNVPTPGTGPGGTGGTGGPGGGVTTGTTCPPCSYTTLPSGARILDGYVLTAAQISQNTTLYNSLTTNTLTPAGPTDTRTNSVEVNAGPCSTGLTRGCTNLVGLPPVVITRLKALKAACSSVVASCYVQVTGGAEGGHQTHGPGLAAVDISDSESIRTYFSRTNPQARTPANGTRVNIPGGGVATYEVTGANGVASGNHWHIQF